MWYRVLYLMWYSVLHPDVVRSYAPAAVNIPAAAVGRAKKSRESLARLARDEKRRESDLYGRSFPDSGRTSDYSGAGRGGLSEGRRPRYPVRACGSGIWRESAAAYSGSFFRNHPAVGFGKAGFVR